MDVCSRAEDEEDDPFEELYGLIERTMNTVECCASSEYVSGDAVCVDLDDDKWEENFMADLAGAEYHESDEVDGEDNGQEDEIDVQLRNLKVNCITGTTLFGSSRNDA